MDRQMRDSFCAQKDPSHFAPLVLGFLGCKMTNSEATLGVTDEIAVFFRIVNADDVHEINYQSKLCQIGACHQP